MEEGEDQAQRAEREKCCPMTGLETLGADENLQRKRACFPRGLERARSLCPPPEEARWGLGPSAKCPQKLGASPTGLGTKHIRPHQSGPKTTRPF